MILAPPTPTLFPYTTLFRSQLLRHPEAFSGPGVPGDPFGKSFLEKIARTPAGTRKARLKKIEEALRIDRKSTRLNSSHTVISYAVFCLKKKKNIYTK